MSADTKTRNYVHVNFDHMTCPVTGCEVGKDKTPQTGSVPGIKRHVKLVHGQEAYDAVNWPALRSADGPIAKQDKDVLFEAAVSRGVIDKDTKPTKVTKPALIAALTGSAA